METKNNEWEGEDDNDWRQSVSEVTPYWFLPPDYITRLSWLVEDLPGFSLQSDELWLEAPAWGGVLGQSIFWF